jgi:ABC-type dipeptide/oligopeptide/nickel transport system ATPase subunit
MKRRPRMKVMTIVGTRPEIIKLSCVICELDRRVRHVLVHTGQNYDRELSSIFFEQLEIRKPDHFLDAAKGSPADTQALSQLDAFSTPWEAVKRTSDLADQPARALLAGAGIAIDAQTAPAARLSGGQRARLAMLLLRLAQPNFYLLDEPTNHLDIEGQDMLEGELIEQGAACLLVSHDRAFVRAVATRVWVIEGRRLVEVEDPDPVLDRLMRTEAA